MEKKVLKSIWKSLDCPKCGSHNYRKFSRTNYPFGRKSKPVKSNGKQCKDCNYTKYDN